MSLSCLQLKNDPIHLVQLITEGSFAKKEYTSPLASESHRLAWWMPFKRVCFKKLLLIKEKR